MEQYKAFLLQITIAVVAGGSFFAGAGHPEGWLVAALATLGGAIVYGWEQQTIEGVRFDKPLTVSQLNGILTDLVVNGAEDHIVYLGGDRLYQARSIFLARLDGNPSIVIEKVDEYDQH